MDSEQARPAFVFAAASVMLLAAPAAGAAEDPVTVTGEFAGHPLKDGTTSSGCSIPEESARPARGAASLGPELPSTE
jgi:hypothetical protein